VVTTTTHKTLRGTSGGLILSKKYLAKAIDSAVFPQMQGKALMHSVAGKAVAFHEALQPSFVEYAKNIIENARAMAEELQSLGMRLVSGGTDNHLMLVDLTKLGVTGKQVAVALDKANIVCNKNEIPFDPLPPAKASGIRLGTPGVTTRGMGKEEMKTLARAIVKIIKNIDDEKVSQEVKQEITELSRRFKVPGISD
jgi:glycine hydroxymethyltransferase